MINKCKKIFEKKSKKKDSRSCPMDCSQKTGEAYFTSTILMFRTSVSDLPSPFMIRTTALAFFVPVQNLL